MGQSETVLMPPSQQNPYTSAFNAVCSNRIGYTINCLTDYSIINNITYHGNVHTIWMAEWKRQQLCAGRCESWNYTIVAHDWIENCCYVTYMDCELMHFYCSVGFCVEHFQYHIQHKWSYCNIEKYVVIFCVGIWNVNNEWGWGREKRRGGMGERSWGAELRSKRGRFANTIEIDWASITKMANKYFH